MASDKATDDEAVFGDEFVADEILARLPARCAARCTVLSKRFRQLIASPHFWLRHVRLGARLELPHASRLHHYIVGNRKAYYSQFHLVGPTFVIEYAVKVKHHRWYASTCNGLVLVSNASYTNKERSFVEGVVFNPATKEEARLLLQLPHPGKQGVERFIIGFGYGPSSKVYKALIHEVGHHATRLMVISLDGSGGQESRTVFSSDDKKNCDDSLHTADGKVYLLIYEIKFGEHLDVLMLAFDVDTEAVTKITIPEGHEISTKLLEVRGRPCIYSEKGRDTVLWLLTADYRWERLYILVKESPRWGDKLKGVWDCGGGLLFAQFEFSGTYMYNLHEAVREEKKGNIGSRLAAVSSRQLETKYEWSSFDCPKNLWDYHPTLVSPASMFGDDAFLRTGCESVAPKHELNAMFLEMTQKRVTYPMMYMLSVLRPPPGKLD